MVERRDDHPLLFNISLGMAAFVLLIFFIYVRFPYSMLTSWIEQTVSENYGQEISFNSISPGFLGGVVVDGLKVNGLPVADKVRFSPRLFDLMTGTLGLKFKADFSSSGKGEGYFSVPSLKSEKNLEIHVSFENANMSCLSLFFPGNSRPGGNATGEFEFSSPRGSYDKDATGLLNLNWKKGSLPLKFEGCPFDALPFENLVIEAHIDKGILHVDKGDFSGDMTGNIRGTVHLSNEIKYSRLNLFGDLNLPPALKSLLGSVTSGQPKYNIRGNLNMPRFQYGSPMGMDIPIASRPQFPPNTPPVQQDASVRPQDAARPQDLARPQTQDLTRPQEPVSQSQQDYSRPMDMRRQQENVPNQTGEQEGGPQ